MFIQINAPGSSSRQTWIELCQKARMDPRDIVDQNLDKLFKICLAASASDAKVRRVFLVLSVLQLPHSDSSLPLRRPAIELSVQWFLFQLKWSYRKSWNNYTWTLILL